MKLWILRPIDENDSPWEPWYDKAFGFVVRAENVEKARQIAAIWSGREGEEAWTNPYLSTCNELTQIGDEDMIIRNFRRA